MSEEVVTASQIDYKQKMFSHPSYKYEPQFPNTFGQPITLGTSQTPVTINIPLEVFNLSDSILSYNITRGWKLTVHLVCSTIACRM